MRVKAQSTGRMEREILPTNVKPVHYDLSFEPDLEDSFQYWGSLSIDLDVVEKTSSISLNASKLKILETAVLTEEGQKLDIEDLIFDKSKEWMTIKLKKIVSAPSKLKFKQAFKGSLIHHAEGFFRGPVKGSDGKEGWMASTHFEPTGARTAFPCFDEPALKATFTVTLIAEPHLTCVANMDVVSEVSLDSHGKNKLAHTYNKTPPMSTYIVAFAVGDFHYIETKKFRVPIRVYASTDKDIDKVAYSLDVAARALDSFEKTFDIAFPLPKVDMIAVPGNLGAMENWGLVTFKEAGLLADPEVSSIESSRVAAGVIVHELAHQWFGNIVTMDFWDGLWLNEGFADWAETHAWQTLEPDWKMWQSFVSAGYQLALSLDSNKASHPIEVPIKRASEAGQIFDDISYNKGCAVIRMISGFLGEDVFIKGVQKYLKKHSYGNTTTNDLWDSLSDVSGQDVGKIMRIWTNYMGYPVLDVAEDERSGHIRITQHRFLQDGKASAEDDKTLYPVSLEIRTKDGIEKVTLYDRSIDIKMPKNFYKLNADQTGFYRVSYPPHRLQLLGQNAQDGLLSAEDRIGIISDAFALASSGYGETNTPDSLALLERFIDESSYFVWKQILTNIDHVLDAWTFSAASTVDSLKVFKNRLINMILMKKGWTFGKAEDGKEKMLKALLFQHASDNEEVQKAAATKFKAFLAGDKKSIDPNLREAVFANVLEHGGAEEFDSIVALLSNTADVQQRQAVLTVLGCVQSPPLITRVLDMATGPDIVARNDTTELINSLTHHKAGKTAAWRWMKEKMDRIKEVIGTGLGGTARLVQNVTGALSTEEQFQEVKAFFEGRNTKSYNMYLAQAMDMILTKARWVERDGEVVKKWLDENGYGQKQGDLDLE